MKNFKQLIASIEETHLHLQASAANAGTISSNLSRRAMTVRNMGRGCLNASPKKLPLKALLRQSYLDVGSSILSILRFLGHCPKNSLTNFPIQFLGRCPKN